ncbi:serine hydrolase [Streptomyces sp. ODS28]|uniref:serine hydrolase n=1 Tax=Streptomyces sp. ODS28 TaxID=3136688 RepID=UPI0031E6454F
MNDERLLRELRAELAEGGLSGSFLVRDVRTGEETGIEPDTEMPLASLVKIPLAVAVWERIADGRLDGGAMVDIEPGRTTMPGPTGLTRFRHPARVAVEDLLYLALCISDNTATDALFGLVPPEEVNRTMREAELPGITLRHRMHDLGETPAARFGSAETHLAHSLAIESRTPTRGHRVPQLDTSRANSGTARALADLLTALWTPGRLPEEVAAPVRSLLENNLIRQRLAPDFASDASRWASKTGTLLNLRHEAGVVVHEDGDTFAVVALTESSVPAAAQPAAEALMARVARALHDQLRDR